MSVVPGRQRHPGGPDMAATGTKSAQAGTSAADLRPGTLHNTAVCSGPTCAAIIRWAVTREGRRMPLNLDPDPAGNVVIETNATGEVRARVLTGHELPALGEAWMPHWKTCPDSKEFKAAQHRHAPKCTVCRKPMDPDLARRERWTTHPSCDLTGVVPKPEKRSA